jgi:dephospho-CoA kinase
VAVTGTIGSGKSVVAHYLASLLQAEYCDADLLCRDLMKKHKPGWQQVRAQWKDRFLTDGESIDRVKLREAVFHDTGVRKKLEAILHPLVYTAIQEKVAGCVAQGKNFVVEIPLLFETNKQKEFEHVVTVFARPESCVERIMLRDSVSRKQALKALESQMDIDTKVKGSDFVIDNSASLAETKRQVEDLSRLLLKGLHSKNQP